MSIHKNLIEKIAETVLQKKELKTISRDFVLEKIEVVLKNNTKLADWAQEHDSKTLERSSKYKELIKKIRAELRKSYGLFSTKDVVLREKYLAAKDYDAILKSHVSTKERMRIYPVLYKKIWEVTGKPKSIMDLGCGMNPFSFKYMYLEKIEYFASDISHQDCDFIQKYFDSEHGINGTTKVVDVLKDDLTKLKETDVCFLFKLLDPALVKNRKTAEKIIETVPATWVIASFSTRTVGARQMNNANRSWILNLAGKKDYFVKVLKFDNELFYVIKK